MKVPSALLLATLAISTPGAADELLERTRTARSFELAEGDRARLVVDNVFGRVVIRCHEARRIDLELERSVFGRSADRLEQAHREVSLEVATDRGLVDLYVDGPFRRSTRREYSGPWHDPGYRVVYDFELEVPRDVDIEIKTVDGGTIEIADIRGSFDVANVNGGVVMRGIDGSGSVRTVNGPARVTFAANPTADSSFVTVNGDVEIHFRAGLSADLDLVSGFGELWTEFEVRLLASRPAVESLEDGRRVIRTDRDTRVRVGAGGPHHSFETLNGDVLIRRAEAGSVPEDKR